jgi:hypothetical protein
VSQRTRRPDCSRLLSVLSGQRSASCDRESRVSASFSQPTWIPGSASSSSEGGPR